MTSQMFVAACGSSQLMTKTPPTARAANRAVQVPVQPQTVIGRRLGEDDNQATVRLKPGTVIHSPRFASTRVFFNAGHGFALILTRAGVIYPATTATQGRRWKIAGPVFFTPTADGPDAVSTVTATPPRMLAAFGAGNFVRVSTDGGRRWWQTELGDETVAVVAADRGLGCLRPEDHRQLAQSGHLGRSLDRWTPLESDPQLCRGSVAAALVTRRLAQNRHAGAVSPIAT
jgi:hypothetical protein